MARCIGLDRLAKRVALGAAFLIAGNAPALSAWAGEAASLTGRYEGKANCSGVQNGTAGKQKREFTSANPVLVTHNGTNAFLDVPGIGEFYLFVENISAKPGQSIVSGITCDLDLTLDGGTLFLNAKVKGDKAALKGTLVILDDLENQSASCKISLKRVDATDPLVACEA